MYIYTVPILERMYICAHVCRVGLEPILAHVNVVSSDVDSARPENLKQARRIRYTLSY